MKITSIRLIEGGLAIPNDGFWPAWWPGMCIPAIGYSIIGIETDEGITGYGPGSARISNGKWAAEPYLCDKVLGCDPLRVGRLTTAPETLPLSRNRPLVIELALWDLLGKAAGLPVYRLLGGYRESVPAYCSTGSVLSAEEHIEQALDAYERGYRAIKLRLHRPDLLDDVDVVEAVAQAIPADMAIMADANQAQNSFWSRATALDAALALDELDVLWLEEPLPMHDVEGLEDLCAAVDIPIAGAENQYSVYSFGRYLEARALDILQPDLMGCGGLLEWRKIAALCDAHHVPCIPHQWCNGLILACNLHAICSVPNAPWCECTDDMFWPAPLRDSLLTAPHVIHDGLIDVPQGPGWGVELNWDVIEATKMMDVEIKE